MSEKILGFLATAAGVAAPEAAELATTDEGIDTLIRKASERDASKVLDIRKDANGRALKIATAAFTKLGVDPSLFVEGREFKDNVAAAAEALQSSALESAGKGTLTDEEILKLPAVKKLKSDILSEADRKVEAAKKEASEALTKEKQEFRKEQVGAKALKYVRGLIDEMNPDFGKNPTIAANRRKELEAKLIKELAWDAEGDNVRLVDTEGEALRDASHNLVVPADKVREIVTSYYELPVSTERQSPGLTPEAAASAAAADAKKFQGEMPKTAADYAALLPTLGPEAKQEVKAWRAAEKPY